MLPPTRAVKTKAGVAHEHDAGADLLRHVRVDVTALFVGEERALSPLRLWELHSLDGFARCGPDLHRVLEGGRAEMQRWDAGMLKLQRGESVGVEELEEEGVDLTPAPA